VNDRISVAIIIPSFNGAHKVLNVFKALERQTFKDFRTILVIDGSTDRTDKLIERFMPLLNLTVINQHNKGRAGARNAGAADCSEDLLIFFDDDIRPHQQCVEKHVLHQLNYKNTAFGGSIKEDPKKARTDFQKYRAYKSNAWMLTFPEGLIQMDATNLFYSSANCSVPRTAFESINGFDESLPDAEDFEFRTRLMKNGTIIYFDRSCECLHDDFVNMTKYIKRQREYHKAWHHLLTTKPELAADFTRFNMKSPVGLKRLFFKIFTWKKWLKIVDKSKILMVLPKVIRYRIYDYIIASLGRYNTHIPIK